MTGTTPITSFRDIPKALLHYRPLQILLILAAVLEIYNVAIITSYTATQKAREAAAIARNAAMRQKAEAAIPEAKAITNTEVARYARQRQKAEAKRAAALARKIKYESEVANASATYAAIQAKAEADAQEAQADLVNQKQQIQSQLNSYVERRKYAEAELAETRTASMQHVLEIQSGSSHQNARDFTKECNEKFEALWTAYQTLATEWDAERLKARLQIHKARCGITSAQLRRLRNSIQVAARPVSPPSGASFRVTSEKLNLRNGPGIRHSIVAEMPAGVFVRQAGACVHSDDGVTHDPWCKVGWNGTKGWASTSGLERVQTSQTSNAPLPY